jgi:hypothetical protein
MLFTLYSLSFGVSTPAKPVASSARHAEHELLHGEPDILTPETNLCAEQRYERCLVLGQEQVSIHIPQSVGIVWRWLVNEEILEMLIHVGIHRVHLERRQLQHEGVRDVVWKVDRKLGGESIR